MTIIFVDTGAWLALTIQRDQYHNAATNYYRGLASGQNRLLTTNYVLQETYTRVRARGGYNAALVFHNALSEAAESGRIRVEWVTPAIHEEAWDVFGRFSDQEFSFVDCTSFVVAHRASVQEVFGFDRDFLIMGFTLKPGI